MKSSYLLIAAGTLLASLPLTAFARIERTATQIFAAEPGGKLTVSTEGGDVRVQRGSDHEVRVEARFVFPHAQTEADADAVMKNLGFSIAKTGNAVTAVARGERKRTVLPWQGRPVTVSFTVFVPAHYHAELKTSGGDVDIVELGGNVVARTSGGDIRLGRITGHIEAVTSGGDITVESGGGSAKLTTSGGDIVVQRIAGLARLNTSGGDIDIADAHGPVQASTSGGTVRARFAGRMPASSVLTSSGGDIIARVGNDAAFQLEASAAGGGVEADGLPIHLQSGGLGKSRLKGVVNQGEARLTLRTSGGDIRIERS